MGHNTTKLFVYVPKKGAAHFGPAHLAGEDLQPLCGASVEEGYVPRAMGTVFGWSRFLCAKCREALEDDLNFEQLALHFDN